MWKIIKRICKVEWCVAIREKRRTAFCFAEDKTPFIPIPNSFRYWAADPFVIDYKGRQLLFVELYDRLKRKGLIGFMDLSKGIQKSFKVVFETCCHLSYPMPFVYENDLYIIPESNNIEKLLLLKWDAHTETLSLQKTMMEGHCLADTNFIKRGEDVYMLSTSLVNGDNVGNLFLYIREASGVFRPATINPVVLDKSTARNGGLMFEKDGKLYRVSQDCSKGYGSGLNIMQINHINHNQYDETIDCKILPQDVRVAGISQIDGLHTYNSNEKYEVIDYKINYKFSLAETLGFLLCKLGVFKKDVR